VCTLVFAWQVFPGTPLVTAANRDELLERPSEQPTVIETDPAVVAPRDAEAGGTWAGVNEHGLLVAITNRWTDRDLPRERSRGLLVRDALREPSAEAATRFVEREVETRAYEGFNLVLADESAALYVEWDGQCRVRNFTPGVHIVVNVGADGAYHVPERRQDAGRHQADNADTVATELAPEPGEDAEAWLDRTRTVIADHDYGVCVHGDGFGTRSSSLLTVGQEGARYEYADGPPCRTEYEHVPVDF
jgi:uncharacterized protein with NRDE domain